MASTTNYNWTTPDNSGLVKNGAQDIRNLGQSIDTFLFRPFTRNAIINGGFDIAQRGTSVAVSASTNTNTLDRFQLSVGANGASTVSQQATGDTTNLPNIRYCARVQRNSGQTGTTTMYFATSMETTTSIPYAGQTVTLSFYARAGANFSSASNVLGFTLRSGTGTDQNVYGYTGGASPIDTTRTLTTTWQRFTATATVAATATELAVYFNYTPTGTASTNDYFEITGIQLEVGSTATPFTRSAGTIAGELAACQRYYFRNTANGAYSMIGNAGIANASTTAFVPIQAPVTMRVSPTSVEFSSIALYNGNIIAITALALSSDSKQYPQVLATVASGLNTYESYNLITNNSTSGYIGFSAEL